MILRYCEISRGNARWPSVNLCLHGAGAHEMKGVLFDSQRNSDYPLKHMHVAIRNAENHRDQKLSWLTHVKHQPATPNHKLLEFRRQYRRDQTPNFLLTSFLSQCIMEHSAWKLFFQDFLKLYFGSENGNFLRNEISRCLLTICSDGTFQDIVHLETFSSLLCILPLWHKPMCMMWHRPVEPQCSTNLLFSKIQPTVVTTSTVWVTTWYHQSQTEVSPLHLN